MYLLESFIDHFGYGIFLGVRTCEVFLRLVSIIFLVFFVSFVYVSPQSHLRAENEPYF